MIPIREEPNLRLEFYLRDVTDAVTLETSCSRSVEVSKGFLEMVKDVQKLFDSAMAPNARRSGRPF